MQEIKILTTREITTPTQAAEFDSEINALLADGWTILTSGISTTTGPVHTYCSVMLVRETQPAPVETPKVFKIDDSVKVSHPNNPSDTFKNRVGTIAKIYVSDDDTPYLVVFSEAESGWYSHTELSTEPAE